MCPRGAAVHASARGRAVLTESGPSLSCPHRSTPCGCSRAWHPGHVVVVSRASGKLWAEVCPVLTQNPAQEDLGQHALPVSVVPWLLCAGHRLRPCPGRVPAPQASAAVGRRVGGRVARAAPLPLRGCGPRPSPAPSELGGGVAASGRPAPTPTLPTGGEGGVAGRGLLHHAVRAPRPAAHGARAAQLQEVGGAGPVRHAPRAPHLHHAGAGGGAAGAGPGRAQCTRDQCPTGPRPSRRPCSPPSSTSPPSRCTRASSWWGKSAAGPRALGGSRRLHSEQRGCHWEPGLQSASPGTPVRLCLRRSHHQGSQ